MRTMKEVAEVLELKTSGLSASTIAKRTGIPRSTVRDWLAERAPKPRQAPSNELPGGAEPAYVYLLGVYLGDGCISEHRRHVFRMRLHLDMRYPGIVDECEAAVARVAPHNSIGRRYLRSRYTGRDEPTYVEVSCYSKRWPALFPQHGPGRKHERKIELAGWQRELAREHPRLLLRGLIHSDGCRNINTGTNWRNPRYSFSNRSDDIRAIFCWACDLLELHWTTAPNTVYVSRKAEVARMDEFIGPKG
jgi:Homeodomain-like domain